MASLFDFFNVFGSKSASFAKGGKVDPEGISGSIPPAGRGKKLNELKHYQVSVADDPKRTVYFYFHKLEDAKVYFNLIKSENENVDLRLWEPDGGGGGEYEDIDSFNKEFVKGGKAGKEEEETIEGVKHTRLPATAIDYHQMMKLPTWAEKDGGTEHPLGTVYSDGDRYCYVQNGANWLRFDINDLDKFGKEEESKDKYDDVDYEDAASNIEGEFSNAGVEDAYTKEDVEVLAKIVHKLRADGLEPLDVWENNKVQDYLTNLSAKYLNKKGDKKKKSEKPKAKRKATKKTKKVKKG